MSFYKALSLYYDHIFPAAPALAEFVARQVPQGGHILDVGAGTGNLAATLAERGYSVTATDVDQAMVGKMLEKQQGEGAPRFETRLLDMRELDQLPEEHYDAVLCVGNSLVHLSNLTEIADVVIRMYDRLKPGGVLILQNVNYDRILRDRVKQLPLIQRQVEEGRLTFLRLYEMEEDGILFQGRLTLEKETGHKEQYENTVRLVPMQSEELLQIAEQYGLPEPQLYGNFLGEAYHTGSTALVALLRKQP